MKMKAIGYTKNLPITDSKALEDLVLERPSASGHDLLVKVKAISVNPVDYKIRQNRQAQDEQPVILGWDAVGEVIDKGESVTLFDVGDQVFYAGDLTRAGSNAEYQLVDERIVGLKPQTLKDSQAAGLPLTTITAWELLFDHLQVGQQLPNELKSTDEVILVVGAAGGVGSVLIQLIKKLTGATVIATASREVSKNWVKDLGADYVINHTQAMLPQIERLGLSVSHIASLTGTEDYFDDYPKLLNPFGRIAMIDDPKKSINVMQLKLKSQSLHLVFMFTHSMYQTKNMMSQHHVLNTLSSLIDDGIIRSTVSERFGTISAKNLIDAHQTLESGKTVGKIVLEGFD